MKKLSKSLHKVSQNFVFPTGSQVVLQSDQPFVDGSGFKKLGSVGVVVESPPHNDAPYVIQFADESRVRCGVENLTLRRPMVDSFLDDTNESFEPYIIYRCQVGSKAFGLATVESDDDIRGIFLPPAERHWSLYRLPEQIERLDDSNDEVFWELEKFLRLALKANPNILETLWTDLVLYADPIAMQLRDLRTAFLSKHLYQTYSGYVISQFRRMKNSYAKTGAFKTKHAMHLVRLLYAGIEAMQSGEIRIDVEQHRDELLRIREGEWPFEKVRQRALELDHRFQEAFESTHLPDQPDFERVNQFLIDARRSQVNASAGGKNEP